jgi:hypothetical protein
VTRLKFSHAFGQALFEAMTGHQTKLTRRTRFQSAMVSAAVVKIAMTKACSQSQNRLLELPSKA